MAEWPSIRLDTSNIPIVRLYDLTDSLPIYSQTLGVRLSPQIAFERLSHSTPSWFSHQRNVF
jgi:hypothetical protein